MCLCYFQEYLGLYQITKSPKYLKDHTHHFISQKENKNTFQQWFFELTDLTGVSKGSSPTKPHFSSGEVYLLGMQRNWFSFSKLVWRNRQSYSYTGYFIQWKSLSPRICHSVFKIYQWTAVCAYWNVPDRRISNLSPLLAPSQGWCLTECLITILQIYNYAIL